MPPLKANAHKDDNQPPQAVDLSNENVSHAEFWAAFQAVTQVVTTNVQGNHQAAVPP